MSLLPVGGVVGKLGGERGERFRTGPAKRDFYALLSLTVSIGGVIGTGLFLVSFAFPWLVVDRVSSVRYLDHSDIFFVSYPVTQGTGGALANGEFLIGPIGLHMSRASALSNHSV